MIDILVDIGLVVIILGILYIGVRLWMFSAVLIAALFVWFDPGAIFWMFYLPLNALILIQPLRQRLISNNIVALIKKFNLLPKISPTETVALRAGSVWLDGEYFSGKPDFNRIFSEEYPDLSEEEKDFLDNETDKVCEMTDDREVFNKRDLNENVWTYLKENKFFGMVIPKEYGGLGFSALGHSAVIQKMASRSQVLAITTMVPNSLGPAELILHYGTQEQKDHYLPRLADGREIPCFALTEPLAGSDATSIKSYGDVFKDEEGNLKISLNFEKRYITLGSVSTVMGMAFILRDPNNLIGKQKDLGITCALVPSDLEGIKKPKRHDPLGVPFVNSHLRGENVVISIDNIIGGHDGIGEGWKMLMESLAVGRGISLPSTSTGGVKLAARVAGAYSQVRDQFALSIGKFEGIEEKLAKISAYTYMLDAARKFTIGAIDKGEKPAVLNAVMKYHSTEIFREVINDAMDIQGGAGISLGERNLLGHAYMGAPIAITVEGANIMTRTLIQFGQGVIRCHPYAYTEIEALEKGDNKNFDINFFKHIGFTIGNFTRMILLSLTRGYLHIRAAEHRLICKYERKIAWSSATFAFLTDFVLGYYGGTLKQKESISARFGDVLSWMYLLSATLARFKAEGCKKEDEIYVRWVGDQALYKIQSAYEEIFANLGYGIVNLIFAYPIRLFARFNSIASKPKDKLTHKIAQKLLENSEARDLLTAGIFIPQGSDDHFRKLEYAFSLNAQALNIYKEIKKAVKQRKLPRKKPNLLHQEALENNIITTQDFNTLEESVKLCDEVIGVDSFYQEEYENRSL